jgi:hypothetical protein
MTSSYYRERVVSPTKIAAYHMAHDHLPDHDKTLLWTNYTLQYPLNSQGHDGAVVHTEVNRIFTPALSSFLHDHMMTVGGVSVDLSIHYSFVPRRKDGTIGIAGSMLFDDMRDTLDQWGLVVTTPMTEEVFAIQEECMANFDRPLVALTPKTEDPCVPPDERRECNDRYMALSRQWTAPVPADKNGHLMLYCWRLRADTGPMVEAMAKAIGAEGVRLLRYGNGYAIVFVLPH